MEWYFLILGFFIGNKTLWFYYVCKYGDIDKIIKENKELKEKI